MTHYSLPVFAFKKHSDAEVYIVRSRSTEAEKEYRKNK